MIRLRQLIRTVLSLLKSSTTSQCVVSTTTSSARSSTSSAPNVSLHTVTVQQQLDDMAPAVVCEVSDCGVNVDNYFFIMVMVKIEL